MDDTDLAQLVTPTLTSISLGAGDRGRIAANMLLRRLADPTLPAQRVTVQPWLVERSSSMPSRQQTRSRRTRTSGDITQKLRPAAVDAAAPNQT
ncbi:MAG: substrate-binding domain-containing protein [Actinomycetota bacterium]|nr:substrate-binding domain-containing protein [Actinomycetota bacterium]